MLQNKLQVFCSQFTELYGEARNFSEKAQQVSILLRLSYRFPRVIEIIFLFPSKVKFDEVNILIVPQSLDQLRSRVVKIEKNSEFGLQN